MSRDSILKAKAFAFTVRIIKLYKYLKKTYREHELSQQVLRAGPSVGALIRESEHAESHKDFIHKLNIGLKEINEAIYWLDLLFETGFINEKMHRSIKANAEEILRMLIASIKTAKSNHGRKGKR